MSTKTCTLEECEDVYLAKGYCSKHYQRFAKTGDPRGTFSTAHGEGQKFLDPKGYVILPSRYGKNHPNGTKSGRIREHIYVMSEYLGRPLAEHENVHHINGQRDDNRIENLELWSSSQPSGQRVSDKLSWAMDLLEQYAKEYPHITERLKGILND